VIVKARFHTLCVKETESGVGVGNFEKIGAGVGAGYFTTDSATLVTANETVTKSPFMPSFLAAATSIRRLMVNAGPMHTRCFSAMWERNYMRDLSSFNHTAVSTVGAMGKFASIPADV